MVHVGQNVVVVYKNVLDTVTILHLLMVVVVVMGMQKW